MYNLHNDKPLTILNSQTSNVSSITSLIFSDNEDNVIVGSNRGSINVWDLNTLKSTLRLKQSPTTSKDMLSKSQASLWTRIAITFWPVAATIPTSRSGTPGLRTAYTSSKHTRGRFVRWLYLLTADMCCLGVRTLPPNATT